MRLVLLLVVAVALVAGRASAAWGTPCGAKSCPAAGGACCAGAETCCPASHPVCSADGASCTAAGAEPAGPAPAPESVPSHDPLPTVQEVKRDLERLAQADLATKITGPELKELREGFEALAKAVIADQKPLAQARFQQRLRNPKGKAADVSSLITPKGLNGSSTPIAPKHDKTYAGHLHMKDLKVKPLVDGQKQPPTPEGKLMQPAAIKGADEGCGIGCVVDESPTAAAAEPSTSTSTSAPAAEGEQKAGPSEADKARAEELKAKIAKLTAASFDVTPRVQKAIEFLKSRIAQLESGAPSTEQEAAAKEFLKQ